MNPFPPVLVEVHQNVTVPVQSLTVHMDDSCLLVCLVLSASACPDLHTPLVAADPEVVEVQVPVVLDHLVDGIQ